MYFNSSFPLTYECCENTSRRLPFKGFDGSASKRKTLNHPDLSIYNRSIINVLKIDDNRCKQTEIN